MAPTWKTIGAQQMHKCAPRFVRGQVGAKEYGGHEKSSSFTREPAGEPKQDPDTRAEERRSARQSVALSIQPCPSAPHHFLYDRD